MECFSKIHFFQLKQTSELKWVFRVFSKVPRSFSWTRSKRERPIRLFWRCPRSGATVWETYNTLPVTDSTNRNPSNAWGLFKCYFENQDPADHSWNRLKLNDKCYSQFCSSKGSQQLLITVTLFELWHSSQICLSTASTSYPFLNLVLSTWDILDNLNRDQKKYARNCSAPIECPLIIQCPDINMPTMLVNWIC